MTSFLVRKNIIALSWWRASATQHWQGNDEKIYHISENMERIFLYQVEFDVTQNASNFLFKPYSSIFSPSTTPYYIPSEFRRHHHHRRSLFSLEIYVFSRIFQLILEATPKHWVRLCAHRCDIDFACSTEKHFLLLGFYIYISSWKLNALNHRKHSISKRWQRTCTCREKKIVFNECQWLL